MLKGLLATAALAWVPGRAVALGPMRLRDIGWPIRVVTATELMVAQDAERTARMCEALERGLNRWVADGGMAGFPMPDGAPMTPLEAARAQA